MAGLANDFDNGNLTVVNVSGIEKTAYKRIRFSFTEPVGTLLVGYEFVATYFGNQLGRFDLKKKAKQGTKIMKVVHDTAKNTTAVTYFFDNHNYLDTEDAYHSVSMFQSILAARIKNRIK